MKCEIFLIRHGNPAFWEKYALSDFVKGSRIKDLLCEYNLNGLSKSQIIPDEIVCICKSEALFMTSNYLRSVESAEILNVPDFEQNDIFREVEMPYNNYQISLPVFLWLFILRVLWLVGYARNCESIREAEKRATEAAQIVLKKASNYNRVVVIGHGFMNILIEKQLVKLNCKVIKKCGSKHWSYGYFILK
jgi:hypothetical protein